MSKLWVVLFTGLRSTSLRVYSLLIYKYRSTGLLNYNTLVMKTIAYLIESNKLGNILIKNKIFAFLYQAAAERKIPVAMFNYAKSLRNAKGVKRNIDQACVYYYKAMNSGYLEARKQLDELYG